MRQLLNRKTSEIVAISLFVRTIATAFFALGMGIAMAQDNLSLSPAHQDVTNEAGSADFAVTTNVPLGDLTVTVTADSVWTEATANAAWSVRSNHASVVFDNKMWVIGGFGGSYQNDVWSSTDGITWTQVTANAAWSMRSNHTSVVYDNKMWVMGGYNGSSQNDVWSSTDGITWTEVERTGTGWSGRSSHTSVVFDDKMWVIGGFAGTSLQDDVWHSTDGATWTEATANAAWSIRNEHTSVVFGGKIWVIGGSASSNLNDVWHSTDGITWTQVITTGTTWSARDNHASVVYDEKMWVIGGDDGSPQNDVWSSTDGITWTEVTDDVVWSARSSHTSVAFDGKMWVIGGYDGSRQDDVWFFGDWLTASLSGTSSPYTLTATYEAKVGVEAPRTGTLTVSGRGLSKSVTVRQGAELSLSPVTQSVAAEAGSTNFTLTKNVSETAIVDDADWLYVSRVTGTMLIVDYEANEVAAPRTGTVTVSGEGLTATAAVVQAGAAPELGLSPATQSVTSEAGSTNFTVTTNVPSGDLTITDDADWLTTERSGTTLTADYEANSMAAPRTGTVTVSGGGLTEMVTVTQAGAAPELGLSPAHRDVTAETGSTNFTVTTNVPSGDLIITDDAAWLTVSLSGTTLTADYEANSIVDVPRTGTVTVSGGGLTEMVTVTQAGAIPELALSPATQSVTSEAGSTNFTVTTNVPSGDLTITDDADWLTVSLSGTTLTADYEANSSTSPRTGTVTVSGNGLAQTVTVVQAETGVTFELALSPAVQSVTNEAGSTSFTVTTNLPADALTTTNDADWLTVSLSGSSSPYTLTADYEANSDTSPRTGTVTVSGGGLTETVTVTQAQVGVVFELTLSPATQSVTNEAGSTSFTVTTNLPADALTTTNDADWLTVSLSGTSSPYTLTADYEANSDTSPRTGTMTVSGGGLTRTVTVVQAETGVTFELALSPATQSVTSEAGSTSFTVTTNLPSDALTTTDDADWLTVSLSGTSSPYPLTADYEANSDTSPRTGTVTVSGGGLTRTVTVVQAETGVTFELVLSPAMQSVTADAGSTNFTVTTNLPADALTTTNDADWLTVSLSGTSSPYPLTADYEANSDTSPRTGTVTVSGGGLTETVTVTQAQAGVVFELTLSPATQSVTNEAGSTDFTVTTNLPSDALTITDDADWLTVSLSGTSSPYPLTADYEANSDTSPRTGTVTVSGGGLTETVTVTQAQAGVVFELSLSPAVQSVTNEAGTTDFTVTTNLSADALTITDDAGWMTTELSGTTLTATYEANEGTDPRTGTVTVSGGGLTETVTVEQEGTPLGLEDETALVVYPNPGVAQVTVDFGDMAQGEGKEWMLLDPSGRKALSGSVARGETTLVINTQGLLSGLYLFQVRGEGQKSYVSHRVVIRH